MQLELSHMQDDTDHAPETRVCPGCGVQFEAGGRGLGKTFHLDECRKAFHRTQIGRVAILPLVMAWAATRHAKPGTREEAICTYARREMTEMSRLFIEQDDEAGRDAVAYVGSLMDSGTIYADRRRS
jgi:hypothetical protein